ncbi:hypothetical protein OSTOST_14200 [Ostertagia ostertagi]
MLTICGRDEKTLNETKSMVLAVNGGDEKKVFLVRGDICNEEVMKEIIDGTVEVFGRLDVLVSSMNCTMQSTYYINHLGIRQQFVTQLESST